MTRKKIDFTYEELVEEIEEFANMLNNEINEGFGNFCLAVRDNTDSLIDLDGKPLRTYREFTSEDIKNSMPVQDAYYGYHYALGTIFLGIGRDDTGQFFGDGMLQFYDLFETAIRRTDSKYAFICDLCSARDKLDQDDDLNIKELALLAGVDERTIRNAASAGNIETIKSGSETLVLNKDAKKWLYARPDFKPTKYLNKKDTNSEIDVTTATAFGQFLALRREAQNLTIGDVTKETGIDVDELMDLEKGIDRIHLSHISKLQNALKIENNTLLNKYMEIFHWEEFTSLKHLFQAEFVSNPKFDVTAG